MNQLFESIQQTIINNSLGKIVWDFVLNYLKDFDFGSILLVIKITSGVLSLVFLVFLVYFLATSSYLKMAFVQDWIELSTFKQFGQKKLVKKWQDIMKKMEGASEAEQKLAVIEAEGILDEVLTRLGLTGTVFGEKLKQVRKDQISNLEDVKKAHEIRNNIVHDPDYKLTLDQAKFVLDAYAKALKDLDMF